MNVGLANYVFHQETRFLYDGRKIIAELDVEPDDSLELQKSYLWGLDLSGSLDGAAGIGGLVSLTDYTGTNELT